MFGSVSDAVSEYDEAVVLHQWAWERAAKSLPLPATAEQLKAMVQHTWGLVLCQWPRYVLITNQHPYNDRIRDAAAHVRNKGGRRPSPLLRTPLHLPLYPQQLHERAPSHA